MIVDRRLTAAEAATLFGASQGTEYIGPYGHCAKCDEITTLDLVTGWSFLEEEEFDQLFLDDGPALVAAMRLQCFPGQVWSMEFAGDLLELTERNRGPQHEYCLRTGESFWSQTPELLVVEAAIVVGPVDEQHCHSAYAQVLNGLRGLRELVLEDIADAARSPDAIIEPAFAEGMADQLPSADELLERTIRLYRPNNAPVVQDFLELLARSKQATLH